MLTIQKRQLIDFEAAMAAAAEAAVADARMVEDGAACVGEVDMGGAEGIAGYRDADKSVVQGQAIGIVRAPPGPLAPRTPATTPCHCPAPTAPRFP